MNRKSKKMLGRVGGITLLAVLSLFARFQFEPEDSAPTTITDATELLEVHYIDVGQGDSIFVSANGESMLIDAGENNKGSDVLEYLNDLGITDLNYVIGTHPHSDHIGGLDTVIRSLPVDNIIMPDVTHTTKTFEELLDAIEEKDLGITKAVVGDEYQLGNASFQIIAPNSINYNELNDYSVTIKLTYNDNEFLFPGDSEKLSEEEMLSNGIDLSSDVLKLGHHGSSSSSSSDFLDAVNPEYAVISVGADNKYGHPHEETLKAMADREIKVYRTDQQGTIVFTSDGQTISVNANSYKETDED
jgi:competence protein ComEC